MFYFIQKSNFDFSSHNTATHEKGIHSCYMLLLMHDTKNNFSVLTKAIFQLSNPEMPVRRLHHLSDICLGIAAGR